MARSPIEILTEIVAVLEQLGIRYALGGSLASSLVGEPRSTVDIDLAVHLDHDQLDQLLAEVVDSYYVPTAATAAAAVAVDKHSAFNLIHKAEAVKIDLFVLGDGVLDTNQMRRRTRMAVGRDPEIELWVTSAEDQVLRKLWWYRQGGEVSDRQWRDVVAILRAQRGRLDHQYLDTTASEVAIDDLLERARIDAA